MLQNFCRISLVLGLLAGTVGASSRADEAGDKGRAIFRANQQAVVIVQLALKNKISYGGRGERSGETRQNAIGTVIDPSGLTVLSLSSTDPAMLMAAMMPGRQEDPRLKMESELEGVKLVLADGTELPAEVVLRDKDNDLAFIRPKSKPAAPLAALDLANPGKADILDQVITLTRLGSVGGGAYSASVERIAAIVSTPRPFYIPESNPTTTTLGAPAFTLDGRPLGLLVMRSIKTKDTPAMVGGLQAENVTGIILPAAEILKAARQVPAVGAAAEAKSP